MKKFLWPIHKFWTFSPYGFVCAIIWNVAELLNISLPFAPKLFSIICGCKAKEVVSKSKKL